MIEPFVVTAARDRELAARQEAARGAQPMKRMRRFLLVHASHLLSKRREDLRPGG